MLANKRDDITDAIYDSVLCIWLGLIGVSTWWLFGPLYILLVLSECLPEIHPFLFNICLWICDVPFKSRYEIVTRTCTDLVLLSVYICLIIKRSFMQVNFSTELPCLVFFFCFLRNCVAYAELCLYDSISQSIYKSSFWSRTLQVIITRVRRMRFQAPYLFWSGRVESSTRWGKEATRHPLTAYQPVM